MCDVKSVIYTIDIIQKYSWKLDICIHVLFWITTPFNTMYNNTMLLIILTTTTIPVIIMTFV